MHYSLLRIRAIHLASFCILTLLLCTGGCLWNPSTTTSAIAEDKSALSLTLRNTTGHRLYISCFSYLKKNTQRLWQWYKTPVYTLEPGQETIVPISSIKNRRDRAHAFGALALFNSPEQAENAIYELLPDENKLDLDRLESHVGGVIEIGIESYGIAGNIFDYDFIPHHNESQNIPELDFVVGNTTGRDLYVAGFIYQRKDDDAVWRYDKTPVVFIKNGESAVIDVDTITDEYDRSYMRGYIGIFESHEKEIADASTFQLLDERRKVSLGVLYLLKNKKILLTSQKYGILGTHIDYTIKTTA